MARQLNQNLVLIEISGVTVCCKLVYFGLYNVPGTLVTGIEFLTQDLSDSVNLRDFYAPLSFLSYYFFDMNPSGFFRILKLILITFYSLTKGPVFWKFSAKNKDVEKIFYLVTYCIRRVKHWTQIFFQLRLFHDCFEACILRNGNVSCHKKYKNMFFVWNSLYW